MKVFKNNTKYLELAKKTLSDKRYKHTINVAVLAKNLAEKHGVNPEQAECAALLHDICKEMPKEELLRILNENVIITSNAAKKPYGVWHAYAGMCYAKNNLQINDDVLTTAIACHTSGRIGMTILDKIIYMADMCSLERTYIEAAELRQMMKENFEEAVIHAFELNIGWLHEDNREVDNTSIEALNDLINIKQNKLKF